MTPAPDKTNPHHARDFKPVVDLGPINPPKYSD